MALQHAPLDLPVSGRKDLGEGKVIYSFNKDQHARLLLSNLAKMQATERGQGGMLTDVVVSIKSNDLKEPFHSILLAACSPTFKHSLTGKHFDCMSGVISLGDMTPDQLKAFRDFFYKSEIPLDEGIVGGLQRVASRYCIDSLAQLCGQQRDQRMSVLSKHHEDVLSQLHDMFRKSELATTFLEDKEGDTQFTVHGPIIAAASPVLKDILSNDLFAQAGTKYRLKEVTSNTLGDLIEYIYTGEVTLEGENVVDLLNAACCYEIPSLAGACCDWLTSRMTSYNAVGIWWVTRENDCEYTSDLQKEAKNFIVANFISVCQEDEFLELMCEDLKEIIQDDNLCVKDVFSAVATWVEADEKGRSSYFCDLLKCVRLENTSLEFLREVAEDRLVKKCVECLQAVHDAHAKLAIQAPIERSAFDGVQATDQRESIPRVEPWRGDDKEIERMLLQQLLDFQAEMPTLRSTRNSDDGVKELTKQTPPWGISKNENPDLRLRENRRSLGLNKKDGSPDMRFRVNKDTLQKGVVATRKEGPLKRDGTPDMRFRVNKDTSQKGVVAARKEGPLKRDGTPDMRFRVNKDTRQKGVVATRKEGPFKTDGTPDMRFKVNKEAFKGSSSQNSASQVETVPLKRDGTPDMRFRVNKTTAAKSPSPVSASGPVKQDGTPDMRFAVNKPSCRSASPQTSSSVAQSSAYAGPLKRDGTPDMRYAVNKSPHASPMSSGYSSSGSPSSLSGSVSRSGAYGPRKRDGTPDMRYSANKSTTGSSFSSGSSNYSSGSSFSRRSYSSSTYSSNSPSSGSSYGGSTSCGPVKRDGTPDMRYAANRSVYGGPSSYGDSSYSAGSSFSGISYGGSSSCGPLKSDGTPDMRYAANRSVYGGPSSYGDSSYSAGSSFSGISYGGSSSCGPLKGDGTPDMRYAANRSVYGGPSSYGDSSYSAGSSFSGISYGGSSSCGPLKSDGTPDMRYAANRSVYGCPSSYGDSSYSAGSSFSGISYEGSSSCGPLKKDGTPDMRFAANRRK